MDTAVVQQHVQQQYVDEVGGGAAVAVSDTGQLPGQWYRCSKCTSEFNTMQKLKTHDKRKHQMKPTQCKYEGCNRWFKFSWDMKNHIKGDHLGNKVKCQYCGNGFSKKSNLHNHLTRGKGCPRQGDAREKDEEGYRVAPATEREEEETQSGSSTESSENNADFQTRIKEEEWADTDLVVDEDPLHLETPLMRFLKENRDMLRPKEEAAAPVMYAAEGGTSSNGRLGSQDQWEERNATTMRLSNLELLAEIALKLSPPEDKSDQSIRPELKPPHLFPSGYQSFMAPSGCNPVLAGLPGLCSLQLASNPLLLPCGSSSLLMPGASNAPVYPNSVLLPSGAFLINQHHVTFPVHQQPSHGTSIVSSTSPSAHQQSILGSPSYVLQSANTTAGEIFPTCSLSSVSLLLPQDVVSWSRAPPITSVHTTLSSVVSAKATVAADNYSQREPSADRRGSEERSSSPHSISPCGSNSPAPVGGETRVRCEHCGRVCSTPAHLGNHIKSVHKNEKSMLAKTEICEFCFKGFGRKSHLREHIRNVHQGKKRVYERAVCKECNRDFARQSSLNQHISTCHSGLFTS